LAPQNTNIYIMHDRKILFTSKKYIIGKNMGPHSHGIIMKRLQKHMEDHSPLAPRCAPRSTPLHATRQRKWFKLLGTHTVCLVQMKRYISPPERWDTHSETSEVPFNLLELSHCHLMLYKYLHISTMP
jgi:hypothetical protein